ncbi:MAG: formate--tetrahydrofolate ligase [Clostridiales bacterium]|nr:formate--tetrahydrofolate ligase [Clostridiales bacterium]
MLTDIEIARSVKPKDISKIASKLKISKKNLYFYGKNIAKINIEKKVRKDAKLILVTSINPTLSGNGKTTVSIGLADALTIRKQSVCLALREPSMGPVFGMKGGATGGGYSQVIPMEDINLHFTGDFHAITSANNLICSAIDNHIFQGNALNINPKKVLFNRCMDLNDRALRDVIIKVTDKVSRNEKFNITAASEIMAILSVASDINDLKTRIGNIMIAINKSGNPVYAKDLMVEEACTILLKDAIMPNLVQTLGGTPALIHCGPFANIAHGCSSIVATKMAMSRAKYVITEAGFGADLGAEKFLDFKCRVGGIKPNCVVIVATIPALKLHGGVAKQDIYQENIEAIKSGFSNLAKHIDNMQKVYHVPVVVTLNKYATDTLSEIDTVSSMVEKMNVPFALNDVWAKGGVGALDLADVVAGECDKDYDISYAYDMDMSIKDKIKSVAKKVYGASKVLYTKDANTSINMVKKLGLSNLPIIIAKTQYSLTDDKNIVGAPKGFEITVKDVEIRSGAGFIVVLLGKMLLMPGLNKKPAYEGMSITANKDIAGLY